MNFLSQLSAAISSYQEVEEKVIPREGAYSGLSQEALLTSLEDYQIIFDRLKGMKSWVELGSGHGHGTLYFAHLNPDKQSIGIEFDQSRFEESERLKRHLNLENATFIHADLLTTSIPASDTYFLYFPTGMVLDRILHELGTRDHDFRLIVIESHGDLLPRLKLESWLSVEQEIPLISPRHYNHSVIFKRITKKGPSFFDHSFRQNYFLIRDDDGQEWVGDSWGLEWQTNNTIQLLHPPRTINESQILNILEESQLPEELLPYLKLRRQGNMRIETKQGVCGGQIRKIFTRPLRLELSGAQIVADGDINKIMAGKS